MTRMLTGRPEPLINRALLVALVSAILTLLDAFGVPLTPEQQAAINQTVAVVAPILVALLARAHVTPVSDPRHEDGEPL